MTLEQEFIAILQLILATVLSSIIGMDRERHQKSAGLRTHMLSGLGSCLFTILSAHAFEPADSSRVAAGVVTGIGFLGAGTIIRRGDEVHDLTTAASIWATAAVGMAVGAMAWLLAIAATILIWTVLAIVRHFQEEKEPAKQDSAIKLPRAD